MSNHGKVIKLIKEIYLFDSWYCMRIEESLTYRKNETKAPDNNYEYCWILLRI